MKFGKNLVKNDYIRVSTSADILLAISVIVHRTKPIFESGQELDESNIHKFGRNRR